MILAQIDTGSLFSVVCLLNRFGGKFSVQGRSKRSMCNCKEMQFLRVMQFGLVFKLLEWVFRQETQVLFSSLVG